MMNNGGSDSSTTEVYADDIEKEANSYFQQMFSGQLTVDEMIQMLAGFKESSEKRFILYSFFLFIFYLYLNSFFFLNVTSTVIGTWKNNTFNNKFILKPQYIKTYLG